jgi:hypothetical protein
MFFRHHSDKILIPIIFGFALFATSYRGRYHLKTEMPAVFFAPDEKSKQPSPEQKIAWAYWNTALMEIQWRYPYSHPLPPDPPAEFQVNAKALGPSASDPAIRLLYWHRLQRVWYFPEIWQKDYGWDFSWIGDPLAAGGTWLKNTAERLFTGH